MTLPEALNPLSWVSGGLGLSGKVSSLLQTWPIRNTMAVPLFLGLCWGRNNILRKWADSQASGNKTGWSELVRERLPGLTSNWSISRHVTHSRPKRLGEYTPGSKPALLSVWNTATPQVNRLEL